MRAAFCPAPGSRRKLAGKRGRASRADARQMPRSPARVPPAMCRIAVGAPLLCSVHSQSSRPADVPPGRPRFGLVRLGSIPAL